MNLREVKSLLYVVCKTGYPIPFMATDDLNEAIDYKKQAVASQEYKIYVYVNGDYVETL